MPLIMNDYVFRQCYNANDLCAQILQNVQKCCKNWNPVGPASML